MVFEIGDIVGFLYEDGKGKIVKKISHTSYIVEVKGIEIPYVADELVKVKEIYVNDMPEKTDEKIHHVVKPKKNIPPDFIDLHIENLLESHLNMTNSEILLYQMSVFKDYMKRAEDVMLRKVYIIHGVGEGVLRSEVRNYLAGFEKYEFMDAPYTKFGYGATEVRIYYRF